MQSFRTVNRFILVYIPRGLIYLVSGVEKMKNLDKRWLFFLLLIIALATGLPYLSLNKDINSSTSSITPEVKSMSIALVNEDEGATFNGEQIEFGEAFVRSLDNDENHEWVVVSSRGVAERGLNDNTFDMMIIIPNDFSQKALSIDSESPEHVVLNYRINVQDDDSVRAEAEKTASEILNDFNRRIIDVYFASIIGNLQEAQDHVGKIIDKQGELTSIYLNDVNNPLASYTNEFGLIKSNTQLSKDNVERLEELLAYYQERLANSAERDEEFLAELEKFASMKEINHASLLSFSESLLKFDQLLNNKNAANNLEQLQLANELINFQLQILDPENNEEDKDKTNIVSEIDLLKEYLEQAIQRVDEANLILTERLEGLEEEVNEKLSEYLREILEVSEEHYEFITTLFSRQDEKLRETINKQISHLPTLNEDELVGYGLPRNIEREIRNVITVANAYNSDPEFDHAATRIDNDEILSHFLNRIKEHLSIEGVTVTDTVWIPENEEEGQEFKLRIPDGFKLTRLGIQLPGQEMGDYTDQYLDKNKLYLPANEEGEFTIRVSLILEDQDSDIDIFEPVKLGWDLRHQYIKNELIDIPDPYDPGDGEEDPPEDGEPEPDPEEPTDPPEEPIDGENITDGVTPLNENDNDEGGIGEEDDPINQIIERLTIFNNRISHEITQPVLDDATDSLIKVVINTISPYQKLFSTFEKYFGEEPMNWDPIELKSFLDENRLKDLPGENSLYKFFNDTEIEQIITDEMIERLIQNVYLEIEEPLSEFQVAIDDFRKTTRKMTEEQLERIAKQIETTRSEAKNLNDNLGEMIEEIVNWREESLNLLEVNKEIQADDGEEQATILMLNKGFQPLLSESLSMVEQTRDILNNTDYVYQSLETIDNQANYIEQIGSNLVVQAETLSNEMTEKLLADQKFAENFTQVLANSRVGERQNENLFSFLSNPVKVNNDGIVGGVIKSESNFKPYFMVLTIFIVVLFTAYVVSNLHLKRKDEELYELEKSLMGTNTPITLITAGIGLLEGLAIGIISSYLLNITASAMVFWTILITTLVVGLLLITTYLLRQLKMIGMFLLLIVLSMYLFLTNSLGTGNVEFSYLRDYSPLHYVERLLLNAVQNNANYLIAITVTIILILVGVLANLLVISKEEKGDLSDEGSSEQAS